MKREFSQPPVVCSCIAKNSIRHLTGTRKLRKCGRRNWNKHQEKRVACYVLRDSWQSFKFLPVPRAYEISYLTRVPNPLMEVI
jgi:hypothetical protein